MKAGLWLALVECGFAGCAEAPKKATPFSIQVLNASKQPVKGAMVSLYRPSKFLVLAPTGISGSGVTDGEGRARLDPRVEHPFIAPKDLEVVVWRKGAVDKDLPPKRAQALRKRVKTYETETVIRLARGFEAERRAEKAGIVK